MKVKLTATIWGLALSVAGAATAQDRNLNLFNWSDYIDPEVIEMFEAETGINVTYDTYDSNEILETKLLAGNTGYDVVLPVSTSTQRLGDLGIIRELDRARLSNWENLWPEILTMMQPYDPGNKLMSPYNFWTFGMVVNEDMVAERLGENYPRDWSLFMEPENIGKLADCGVHLVDSSFEFIAMTLK